MINAIQNTYNHTNARKFHYMLAKSNLSTYSLQYNFTLKLGIFSNCTKNMLHYLKQIIEFEHLLLINYIDVFCALNFNK